MIRRGSWMIVALLTAGCASSPAFRPPELAVDVPGAWKARTEPGSDAGREWWKSFGDPRLDELVERARGNNYDLKTGRALVEQLAALARISGAELKPSVSAGLGGSRGRQNFIGLPIPGVDGVLSTTSTSLGLSVSTSWEADLWGRVRAGVRASLADLQAAGFDYDTLLLAIESLTVKAWFAVQESTMLLALAEDSAASFRDRAELVRSRYETGIRSPLDLRLALASLAQAEALTALRRRQLDGSIRLLETLVGDYPAGALVARTSLPESPPPVAAGLPAELISRRPDLLAAERRLAAADARLAQARRSLYPRLSLTASGGTASDQLQDLLDGDFRVWSIVANLAQPLFQGGRLRAAVDAAASGTDGAIAAYASTALAAFAEVESALAAEGYLAERERHLVEATTQSRAAERLALDRYRSGLGDYLTVLEAQTRALTAEIERIVIRRSRLDNRVDLHLALGGGLEPTTQPIRLEDASTASRGEGDRAS